MITLQRICQEWQVLLFAFVSLVPCCLLISEMTESGMAAWCLLAGSVFLNAQNSHCKINAGRLPSSRDGFG